MMILNIAILVLIVLLVMPRLIPAKGVRQITTDTLKNELKDKDKQFIDVRTPAEYKGNHIKEFKNIPLHQLPEKSAQLSKDKEVVVICQSGMRSSKACKILKKQGFKQITNVKGGMSAWK